MTSIVVAMIVILVVVAAPSGSSCSESKAAGSSAHPSWPIEWPAPRSISTAMQSLRLVWSR